MKCHVNANTSRQWQSSWNKAAICAASLDTSAASKAWSQFSAERRAWSAICNCCKEWSTSFILRFPRVALWARTRVGAVRLPELDKASRYLFGWVLRGIRSNGVVHWLLAPRSSSAPIRHCDRSTLVDQNQAADAMTPARPRAFRPGDRQQAAGLRRVAIRVDDVAPSGYAMDRATIR